MRYPHTITVTRPGEGSGGTDDFGQPVSESSSTIYEGKADVQDGISERTRSQFGDVNLDANAVVFLPERKDAVSDIEAGDRIETPFGEGTVKGRRFLDSQLAIKLDQ